MRGWLALRRFIACAALLLAAGLAQAADPPPLRSLVLVGFELQDDHPNPEGQEALAQRLLAADRQLREGLARLQLYRLLPAEAGAEVAQALRERHASVVQCIECAQLIGQAAGSELVLLAWVQKVSELILNLNVEVRETASDRVLLNKSVDIRGNNDQSWERGLRFMLRDWAERRQRNPAYGQ